MEPEPTRHATDAEPDVGADPQTDEALDPEIEPQIVPQIENPSLDLDTIGRCVSYGCDRSIL